MDFEDVDEREPEQDWDWDHGWQVEYEIEKRGE